MGLAPPQNVNCRGSPIFNLPQKKCGEKPFFSKFYLFFAATLEVLISDEAKWQNASIFSGSDAKVRDAKNWVFHHHGCAKRPLEKISGAQIFWVFVDLRFIMSLGCFLLWSGNLGWFNFLHNHNQVLWECSNLKVPLKSNTFKLSFYVFYGPEYSFKRACELRILFCNVDHPKPGISHEVSSISADCDPKCVNFIGEAIVYRDPLYRKYTHSLSLSHVPFIKFAISRPFLRNTLQAISYFQPN